MKINLIKNTNLNLFLNLFLKLTLFFFISFTQNIHADEFGEGDLRFHISFVPISSNEPSQNIFGESLPSTDYSYRISKTEISIAQFLQARADNPRISKTDIDYWNTNQDSLSIGIHAPVSKINFIESLKFCNWLTSGDPYQGAYKIIKEDNPEDDRIDPTDYVDRDSAIATFGTIYAIPTYNEWRKAAFMKPDGSFSFYSNGAGSANIYDNTPDIYTKEYQAAPRDIVFLNNNYNQESEITYMNGFFMSYQVNKI